jgi:hypothetical protein
VSEEREENGSPETTNDELGDQSNGGCCRNRLANLERVEMQLEDDTFPSSVLEVLLRQSLSRPARRVADRR